MANCDEKNSESGLKGVASSLLINRPAWLTLREISDNTGLGVGWLKAFGQKRIDSPGVQKIETLIKYLNSIEVK